MEYHFVVNPHAGGVHMERIRRALIQEFSEHRIHITSDLPFPFLRPGAARHWPEERILVAVGGDGTVNRLVNAVGESGIPIGLLPRGTANDLARHLGIPRGFRAACAALRTGCPTEIDLAMVNDRYFVTGGGLGLGARIAQRADAWKQKRGPWGGIARQTGDTLYVLFAFLEILGKIPRFPARVEFQQTVLETDLAALIVNNQPKIGGRFSPTPSAANQDGHLDLCLIRTPPSRGRMARICLDALRGESDSCPEVARACFRDLRVTTKPEAAFFGDGEILVRGREFNVRVRPRALRVLVPEPSSVLQLASGEASHGV